MEAVAAINLSRRKLRSLVTDSAKSAEAINLVYVSDTDKGIMRIRKGKSFSYMLDGKTVKNEAVLSRIKGLVIPPAWEKVWICTREDGHLQVTGVDVMGRKQYRYHPLWTQIRNHTKFYHLYEFGKALPGIRERLANDLSLTGLPLEKVLAVVVSVMQETGIRIGNGAYEKLYGSYGLSTLKDEHVKIKGNEVRFVFRGKKGVAQDLTLKSKKLARLVKNCQDIPGKELFQYYAADGTRHSIDSGMVNTYIKDISGGHFTAKDFRTWTGTVQAILALNQLGCASTATETKQRIVAALDTVSLQLGNTRAVCKKYYVHPALLEMYECNTLEKYLKDLNKVPADKDTNGMHPEEQVLMKILSKA